MIKSLGHVALGVSDLERSLEFYRDFLGMRMIMDLDIHDERIGRVIGKPDAACRIVHLQLGATILEVFQYTNPKGKNIAAQLNQWDQGFIHIGFEVDHFHTHIQEMRDRGVEFIGEPVEIRPGVWVVYLRGPDGEVFEFRQQP